jgi:EAL domain-containing protein (putative c-di-GMP-specific phosphodiesterase class I)
MQEQTERNFTMHQAFHDAIHAGQLRMHLQPQFHARGHMVGTDALIRWEHANPCMFAPGSFLSIVEECGLDTEMGNWMLHTAGAWAAQQARMGREIRVSVNVNARHLVQSDFPVTVCRHFCSHGDTLD